MQITKQESAAVSAAEAAILEAVQTQATRANLPLGSLVLSKTYQARKQATGGQTIEQLAAAIQSVGLLQNLVGVKCDNGKVEICAGGRRLQALGQLSKDGQLPHGYLVPVLVIPAEFAHHASLLENHSRNDMHPADVFDAYRRLQNEGWTVEAIAAAHGASVTAVKKLLALADVSPKLLKLYRRGDAQLEDMQALAAVADHARQEAAWSAAEYNHWNRPTQIRLLLSQTDMPADAPEVRYVTLAAYEKAGGTVRRDLFAEGDDEMFVEQPEIITSMALQKMRRSKLAKQVETEGWGWIEFAVSFRQQDKQAFGELRRTKRAPTQEELSALADMEAQWKAIELEINVAESEEAAEEVVAALHEKHERVEHAIEQANNGLFDFDRELKPMAGCVVHLDYYGKVTVTKGLIKSEDRQVIRETIEASGDALKSAASLPPAKTRPVHSQALTDSLQAHYAIAMQAELAQRPNLALCLLIAQMLQQTRTSDTGASGIQWFDMRATCTHWEFLNVEKALENTAAWTSIQEKTASWKGRLPEEGSDLVPFLLTLGVEDLLDLLALLVARTVYRTGNCGDASIRHLHSLQGLMQIDLSVWWSPTASNYFSRVSKDQIIGVVTTAVGAEAAAPLRTLKKAEAACAAEAAMRGKAWLPDVLRPVQDGGSSDTAPDASQEPPHDALSV